MDSFSLVKNKRSFMLCECVQLLLLLKVIFSAFHKVQWRYISGVVDRFKNTYVEFLQDFVYQILTELFKKGGHILEHSVLHMIGRQ